MGSSILTAPSRLRAQRVEEGRWIPSRASWLQGLDVLGNAGVEWEAQSAEGFLGNAAPLLKETYRRNGGVTGCRERERKHL